MSDREIFTEIYRNNKWGSSESVSGEGSEFARTVDIREQLPALFAKYDIYSVLDIGCGDFNWMKSTIGVRSYMGIDIVEDMIEKNNELYGSEKIKFSCRNILDLDHRDFRGYDCVILRDVFVHLSNESALSVLNQVRLGSIPYVFMTNFLGCLGNVDIPTGHWRPLNMLLPPFAMGTPIDTIVSYREQYMLDGKDYFDKTLTLWRMTEITTGKHNTFHNDIVISQLKRLEPQSLVDVGTGDGYWAKVIRLLLPKCHISGVELSPKWYVHCLEGKWYDILLHADIYNAIKKLRGDVILFGDVLEHIEKEDAMTVLREAVKRFKYVIINSPVGFQPQEHEDVEEIHRCGLTIDDFCDYTVLAYHESGETAGEYKVFTVLILGNES